jgi:hypothetical protein
MGTPGNKVLAQKIKREYRTPVEIALKYYAIRLALNNIFLSKRELELLSFTAVRGTISSSSAKDEFVRQFGSSKDTINNMISKLSRHPSKLLVKVNGKTRINPALVIDFSHKDYIFQFRFKIQEPDDRTEAVGGESDKGDM